jgi:hypothetical protein
LTITSEIRNDISKWRLICSLLNSRTVMRGVRRSRSPYEAYSDASFSGWGWTWLYFVEDGDFPSAWKHRFGRLTAAAKARLLQADPTDDPTLERQRIWIQFCEALAALFCLRRVLPFVANLVLVIHQDNQAVAAMLTKLQTSSVPCQPIITEIAWLLAVYNVELDVRYIKSADNVVADCASRVRSGDITSAQYKAAIQAHFTAHSIPQTLTDAGVQKSVPVRTELVPAVDLWTPLHDGGVSAWYPPSPVSSS